MTIYKPVEWPKYEPIKDSKQLKLPQREEEHWAVQGAYQYGAEKTVFPIVFALVWGLGGPAFLLVGLSSLKGGSLWFGLPFILGGVAWAGFALYMIWTGIRNSLWAGQERKFTPARLLLPDQQLRAGQTARVTLQRELKGGKELPQNGQLHARLLRVEVTRRKAGTDVVYDHTFLSEEPLATQGVFAGQSQVSVTWQITLPPDAQPNLISDGHWVFWQVQVLQELPSYPPMLSEFMLPVAPR